MKNNFEHIIKNSLENHEVPYETGAWEKFNKAQIPTPFYKSKWFKGGGASLIAVIAAVILLNLEYDSTNTQLNVNNKDQSTSPVDLFQIQEESFNKNTEVTTVEVEKEEKVLVKHSSDNTLYVAKEKGKNDLGLNNPEEKINTDFKTLANLSDDKTNLPNTPLKTEPEKSKPTLDLILPSATFFIEKTICEGNDINLLADKTDDNYNYSWKLNDNEIVSGKVISMKANLIGENEVTLFIEQDGLQIAEKKKTFIVLEAPTNNTKIELNQAVLINELKFDMEDASNQIVWNFGDGETSVESNSTHTYKKAGKYTCEYTITAKNGCSTSFERNINVKGYYNLRTDYGFSPGRRDNLNDVFIPVELKELNVSFEMSIYARNGQLLYTSTSLDKPWNGKVKDGSTCTFGSYVWVVSLTNELGEKEVYKGTVTNVNN